MEGWKFIFTISCNYWSIIHFPWGLFTILGLLKHMSSQHFSLKGVAIKTERQLSNGQWWNKDTTLKTGCLRTVKQICKINEMILKIHSIRYMNTHTLTMPLCIVLGVLWEKSQALRFSKAFRENPGSTRRVQSVSGSWHCCPVKVKSRTPPAKGFIKEVQQVMTSRRGEINIL